jgi:hypothetical protein
MNSLYARVLQAALATALCAGAVPAVAAATEPAPIQREIIPGSELMTSQEREQYRQRQQGAKSADERERLREDHVKAMEERARVRGLKVSDPTRERARKGKQ